VSILILTSIARATMSGKHKVWLSMVFVVTCRSRMLFAGAAGKPVKLCSAVAKTASRLIVK
jgi:hypothetical protein